MTKKDKLLERFLSAPKDFTYDELKTVLNNLGYEEDNKGKTSGSRVSFIHESTKHIISLHKPHPSNILKSYQINMVVDALIKMRLL